MKERHFFNVFVTGRELKRKREDELEKRVERVRDGTGWKKMREVIRKRDTCN